MTSACNFLDGDDLSPLESLEREMTAASAALAFERAAMLRDKLDAIRWLHDHLSRLRTAGRQSFVYPVSGHDGDDRWYLIHGGRVRATLSTPCDEVSRRETTILLTSIYHDTKPPGAPSLEEIDSVLLVAAWFRRHAAERARTLTPAAALATCLS